ncbi:hypothetical protein VPHD63_0045 [Vibrio phage D63]
MKKLLPLLIACALNVNAAEESTEQLTPPTEEKVEMCDVVFQIAERIMAARQIGVEVPRLRDVADSDLVYGPAMHEMITEAYNDPQLSVRSNRVNAAREFANRWATMCYEAKGLAFNEKKLLRF